MLLMLMASLLVDNCSRRNLAGIPYTHKTIRANVICNVGAVDQTKIGRRQVEAHVSIELAFLASKSAG